jgi:hypothetical protein
MNTIKIEFLDFKSPNGKGRRLPENSVSVWYNNGEQKTYGITFSNNIMTDKKFVRVGKIGEKLCLFFNDEDGIRVTKSKNMICHSKSFIEYIFVELNKEKDRKVFELEVMSSDLFIIKKEIS